MARSISLKKHQAFADEADLLALAAFDSRLADLVIQVLASQGTPLEQPSSNRYTFLFQHTPTGDDGREPHVHLFLNRLTDKHLFEQGTMRRVPGTSWWVRTLTIAPTYQGSYGFGVSGDDQTPTHRNSIHGKESLLRDPQAQRLPLTAQMDYGLSHFAAVGASEPKFFAEWPDTQPACLETAELMPGSLREHNQDLLGCRPVFLWTPAPELAPANPSSLVILFDADSWFTRFELHHALDAAVSSGLLPPCAVVGIGVNSISDRKKVLGGNVDFIERVLAWAPRWASETLSAEASPISINVQAPVVLAGQSLGGILALLGATLFPAAVSSVIAQSPSMWWEPAQHANPGCLGVRPVDWISERFSVDAPAHSPEVYLAVGARETPLLPRVALLALAAQRAGWIIHSTVEDGGHDYCWWRENLIELLIRALTNRQ
ncbi:alpha/beta hydrolase-fold protein [Corynebacterium gerontici]|uniref:Enterochelin esterase n=1 Tax=Corynebacterium gerontici TaxID=2079234 RepID=A0A3G6J5B7_9CORY|nr:alpha/beta hydrolase-fold protein [Corynebacterium gerontici]AZA12118.1 Enterochelin esterase [Corynebacterium gerontici]